MNILPKQNKTSTIQLAHNNIKQFLTKYVSQLIDVYRRYEITPCVADAEAIIDARYHCYYDKQKNQYKITIQTKKKIIVEKKTHLVPIQVKKKKKPIQIIKSRLIPLIRLKKGVTPVSTCRCECCQALTKKGDKCKNKGLYDGYCWIHRPI